MSLWTQLYPRKLDVRNHQCSDDRMFIRTGAISPMWYAYRTNQQALSNVLLLVSIALTVLEIQLNKVKVSEASSRYQVLFAKGVNFGKRLYLENGKCYEFRIGLLLKVYRFV